MSHLARSITSFCSGLSKVICRRRDCAQNGKARPNAYREPADLLSATQAPIPRILSITVQRIATPVSALFNPGYGRNRWSSALVMPSRAGPKAIWEGGLCFKASISKKPMSAT